VSSHAKTAETDPSSPSTTAPAENRSVDIVELLIESGKLTREQWTCAQRIQARVGTR
jgi:hypothetical protein